MRIRYKEIILQSFAEHADATVESLIEFIDAFFRSKPSSYRALRRMLSPRLKRKGVRTFTNFVSANAVRVTLSRLKREGLVESRTRGVWKTTLKGRQFLKEKPKDQKDPFSIDKPTKILVSFDIPESVRTHRVWLRRMLKEERFIPLQKSVWIGNSMLSEELAREILRRGLKQCVCIIGIRSAGNIESVLRR